MKYFCNIVEIDGAGEGWNPMSFQCVFPTPTQINE